LLRIIISQQERGPILLGQGQGRLGAGLHRDCDTVLLLRVRARVDCDQAIALIRRREYFVGRLFMGPRVGDGIAVLNTAVVGRHCALQRRRRTDLVRDIATTLLAGLGEVGGFVGPVDLLVRVRDDRDLE
jgi:hypothetical protein